MNRIYQGRITAVQMAKPIVREELNGFLKATKKKTQGNWQNLEKEKWENLLWQHHELFQDAVNYYTLALGALGEGLPDSHPLQKLRARMQEAWDVFPKRTVTPAISLGNSLRKHLGLKATATFDDACRKIVPPDIVEKELAAQVADFLSVDLTKTSDLSEYGRSAAPRYINPDYKGNFRDEFARKTLEALELRLAVHDLVPRNLADFGALSLATASQRENRNDKTGEDARKALIGFVKKLAMAGMLSEPKAKELTNQLKQLKAEKIHQIPAYEAGGDSKEKSLGIPALLIGKQLGFDLAIKRCLTASIPKPAENWQNGLNQARETVKKGADPLLTARGNQGYVFLAFTALPTWKEGGETKPTWIEFDIAAFKEALVTINQFNEKTKEREERKTAVSAELEFMLGGNTNWSPKTQSEEDEREVPVLAGDPRYEKLLDILEQMDDERAVQDKTKIVGPTQAALRGFGKLRSTWIDLHREKLGQPGETLLQQAVTNLQREHKLDMGHTDLFLRLCTQENWTVWLEDEDQNVEIEGSTKRARNVVCAAAVAQELADELERLQEAIRYTPAEPQFSRRLYMFSDIKNKESVSHIGYGNVDVYVAAHNEQGKLAPCRLRLNYAAPRMVRDQLADGAASKWLQPMMAALGLQPEEQPQFARDSKGRTKPPAVELMPDWVGRKRFLHFLLNFPVDIDTEKLTQRIGKSSRWAKQMNAAWEKNKIKQRFHVMWDNMEVKDTQKPNQWWWDNPEIQRDGFTCLAIDLGQRRAADFALLHTAASELKDWFVRIGEAGGKSWYTRIWKHENPARPNEKVSGIGSLRLPGEDAKVFYKGKAGRELSGKKGRLADADDYEEAIELAEKLLHSDEKAKAWLGDSCSENSFPEQNDKLVRLFLGALSRYRTWHRWSWQLQPKHSDCWERIFKKEIAKIPYFREWGKLAEAEVIATNAAALQAKVAKEANELRQRLEQAVERLANRVVPLRDNTWRWIAFGTDPRGKPLHQLAADGEKQEERPWLRGQRGLSLNRIEQLEIFRRGILSLNRLMRHQSGVKPDFGKTTLGETLPDPCSVLTDKIVRMKEERVNQTAHMILAQALGVQLKAPSCDDKNRAEQNIHGEYEPIPGRNPVDFIVLEDLSRYTTDKSRARAENSRLMKWCHRAINEKVKMLAEPFGIPVVEVFASFTSKFDAMTGAPGFRASEISLKERSRWAKAIEREPHMAKLFHQLDEALQLGVKNPRLLAPQQLGEFFVAAKHVKIGDDRKMLPKIRQADINAAVNIGLRAIGSPNCFHAHPRVRIEREVPKSKKSKKSVVSTSNVAGPSKWITRRENKREKAQFESATEVSFKKLSVESTLLKEGKATLMHDPLGIASFGHAMIREHDHPRLAHNAAIFSRRKNELGQCTGAIARLEWGVCEAINAYRMKAWREKASGGFHKDEIPFD